MNALLRARTAVRHAIGGFAFTLYAVFEIVRFNLKDFRIWLRSKRKDDDDWPSGAPA